jgi:hypothetical protein
MPLAMKSGMPLILDSSRSLPPHAGKRESTPLLDTKKQAGE